jgi:hypothetical protein
VSTGTPKKNNLRALRACVIHSTPAWNEVTP